MWKPSYEKTKMVHSYVLFGLFPWPVYSKLLRFWVIKDTIYTRKVTIGIGTIEIIGGPIEIIGGPWSYSLQNHEKRG